ncbi:Nickel responsive regulator NikR [Thioalkalivibrio nitratireducens DSM 14787]|uniref:Putative nickel-responsive regulator n=1 Tax=Thioalkalivibrio nitratireducens (strain DSM 14787 / UNIQEM 213 / ALEN2) TaxID=1255043 RepID=L0DVF2_THIND|nr:nickel-responsive transcriptional regulator NikR [Thioalkalivibrio nitratireducens]AGA32987.1 Nickel responsive regulator NikR [Thioalkalivibrio nitratireducens DSM 14787]
MSERFTVSIEPQLAQEFDAYIKRKGYSNRSEAVRDLIRGALAKERLGEAGKGHCVGVLSYMYDHHERELSKRLTQVHHANYNLTVTTLHMHLDHDLCVESVLLKGHAADVQAFAESVMARPGIRHGQLHRIPLDQAPAQGPAAMAHGHGLGHGN